jgi:HTH-type transcriptional regulator/antitoxin HigA
MRALTSYQSLLLDYESRPIRSEAAYRKALRHVEKLMRPRLSRDESELVEVLATLIEQYESREHPTPKSPPREMLAHLMEARGAAQAAVARATGIPRSTLSAVLAGRRKVLNASQALFAQFLGVSVKAVRKWESGQAPSEMACRFMDEIRRNPKYWHKRLRESMRAVRATD